MSLRSFISLFNKHRLSVSTVFLDLHKIADHTIQLSDKELFLSVYGTYEEPLFIARNVGIFLDILNLDKKIVKTYKESIDYKRDNKFIYLTYKGMLKTLFIYSTTLIALEFMHWYEINFTEVLPYIEHVHEIFSKFEFPCIYLLYIGNYKEYQNVYKFGRTENFNRRYRELNKTYNCVFKICTLQFIDPEYLSSAEVDVHRLVTPYSIVIENHVELIALLNPNLLIEQYKAIGKKYSVHNKILREQIIDLQYRNKILALELQVLKNKNPENEEV
jgi:hypothetical protein